MAKLRKLTKKQIRDAADRAEGKATPPDDADAPVMGRPSEYNDAFAEQARQMYEHGATDAEVADFFSVSVRTIQRWAHKYPLFCLSLKAGKVAADDRVERSLFHKANGYTYEAEEVFQYQGQIVRAKVVKHVPPDSTAMIFWLKNRRPAEWRDRHEIDHSGKITHENRPAAEVWAEIVGEMTKLGVTAEMLALPEPAPPMVDVSPGVANRPNGKGDKTKH